MLESEADELSSPGLRLWGAPARARRQTRISYSPHSLQNVDGVTIDWQFYTGQRRRRVYCRRGAWSVYVAQEIMTRFQIQTPDWPDAADAAGLILQLLKQDVSDLDPARLDHTFFRVLANFEAQAAAAGMARADNPFRRMSDELVQWLHERTIAEMHVPDVPEEFAEDLGRFRHMTQEARHQPGMLVLAVRHLEPVAARIDPDKYPAFRSAVYNDLGTTYADLHVPDRRKALLRALACYEIALEYRSLRETPREYVATMYNRGNARLHLPAHGRDRTAALRAAIADFRTALAALDSESYPYDDALINLGLGVALALLPTATQANLADSRACFARALTVFARETYAAGWGLAMSMFGTALYFGEGDYVGAAERFRGALEIYGGDDMLYDAAALNVSLALTLLEIDPQQAVAPMRTALALVNQPRSTQQHAQLADAFGPAAATRMVPEGREALAAQRTQLEAASATPLDAARTHLLSVPADPAHAAEHVRTALENIARFAG